MWDAAQYSKYLSERTRPFLDLLGQVPANEPRLIVDLGCGLGNLTRILAERWPSARVIGIDSSPEMLGQAKPIPGRLEFVQADIGSWAPGEAVDVLLSNAALHWIPDHAAFLARLTGMLAPGGTLAVQMPNRFQTASHAAVEATLADARWSHLKGVGLHRESVMPILWYVQRLRERGLTVNAWETTYVHVMPGRSPVVEWLKGTALRPLLERLDSKATDEFLDELGRRLDAAYPPDGNVTLFPMPRIFFVATR